MTVTAYDVDGTRIMVPQRVDPERVYTEPKRSNAEAKASTVPTSAGASEFVAYLGTASPELQAEVKRLADWAISLEQEGLVRLLSGHGKGRMTLLPRLDGDDAGLVTIWNDGGVSLWRTVFERRPPDEIPAVETDLGTRIGTGNTVRDLSDDALRALSNAYRTAAAAMTRSLSS